MRAEGFAMLDLNGKGIGVAGGMVVAGLMPDMGSLNSIDVSKNDIGNDGKHAIATAIPSSTLQSVKCDGLDLRADATSLDLSSKRLRVADAELLAAAMAKFVGSLTQ
eukprot:4151486-Prymnesium_polylepis.1